MKKFIESILYMEKICLIQCFVVMQEQIVIKMIELNGIVVRAQVDIFSTNEKICAI